MRSAGELQFGLRLFPRRTSSCAAALPSHSVPDFFFMKSKFEPDHQSDFDAGLSPALIDPEAYDASEQVFAASLEPTVASRPPKFVVEDSVSEVLVKTDAANRSRKEGLEEKEQEEQKFAGQQESDEVATEVPAAIPSASSDAQAADPESWRREVAARLSHYRARRRPREPRYPSLQLKFETESVGHDSFADDRGEAEPAPEIQASQIPARGDKPAPGLHDSPELSSVQPPAFPRIRLAEPAVYPRPLFPASNEATAKVIEFASYSAPVRPFDELAEPVLERPRIIEAADLVPPAPALGGISIEPADEPANERRPGFEIPLQAAPMGRRMAAGGIDALLVTAAIGAFGYIFFRIANDMPSPARVASLGLFLVGSFWCAYQYLLLVYSGTTPGLKLAKLELQRFDGDPVPRRLRRWRVLASLLSGVSLGLGYAWCLLDEDQLCWHDRITRTYMAPRNKS